MPGCLFCWPVDPEHLLFVMPLFVQAMLMFVPLYVFPVIEAGLSFGYINCWCVVDTGGAIVLCWNHSIGGLNWDAIELALPFWICCPALCCGHVLVQLVHHITWISFVSGILVS